MNIEQIIKSIDDWKVDESCFKQGLYQYSVYKGDESISFELEVRAYEGAWNDSNDRDVPGYFDDSTLSVNDLRMVYYDGSEEFNVVTEIQTEDKIKKLLIQKLYANHDV